MQNFGDATLVSSTWAEEERNNQNRDETLETTTAGNMLNEEVIETVKKENSYFTTSKLERENMYSQMLETYQEIYNNNESTSEQKTEALNEISKINNTKNAIMIAENLLSAKGFKNTVIFSNTNSISVIVGEEELLPEQIAQIQNIVSRELSVNADIIHISTK